MKLPTISLKDFGKPKESKLFLALLPAFKEKKTRQFSTLVFSFITIAFFGLFAINPTVTTIADLQKQIDDSNFVHEQLQKKIANLTTLQTEYTTIEPVLSPILSAVPTDPSVAIFVGQVHQLATDTNVQLTRVQTLPFDISKSAKTPYTTFAFNIEGQGAITALQEYVSKLAIMNRVVSFDNISYARIGKVSDTFRSNIRGKAYFKQEAQ